jgi:mevalonate kinase
MSERVLTKILVYDLPSENFKALENTPEKDKVRNVRVQCVQRLHTLGLQCTESVILVTPSRLNRVNEVVERVYQKYEELKREISHIGLNNNLTPVIRILDLTQEQQDTFVVLAKRRLMERIDESIERINEIIIAIDEITQEERRRALRYRLNQLRKEWSTVLEASRELGIDVSRDLEYLLDLIDNARGRLD